MLDTIHLRKNLLSWRSIPMGPQGFPKLQYIKNIYLTDNKIEQCPWEFGYLTNLESLAINTNKYFVLIYDYFDFQSSEIFLISIGITSIIIFNTSQILRALSFFIQNKFLFGTIWQSLYAHYFVYY